MASKPRSLNLVTITKTGDKETSERLELLNPSVTSLEPVKPVRVERWAEASPDWRPGYRSDIVNINITGNIGLYEKLDRMIADCYKPVGPFYSPPPSLPASTHGLALPAALLAASLLALALLASGLG